MRKVIAAFFTLAFIAGTASMATACPFSSAPKDTKTTVACG